MAADKLRNVRATLIELYNRVIEVNSSDADKMYINGEGNLYPNEIERVINNSPTASRCARLMSKYIAGAGVLNSAGELATYSELPIVNPRNNLRITDIISAGARSISYQYGVFFHIGWGVDEATGKLKQKTIEVLDYTKARISKEDGLENPGKIYFKDFEVKKTFGSGKGPGGTWFYPYTDNLELVLSQIKKDAKDPETPLEEAIKNYRGQVYYLNLTPEYIYSVSPADSIYNEADSEYRISLYTNKQVRSGFLGKTAVLTSGLDEATAKTVQKDLALWLGAENSDNMYHLDVEETGDLDKVLKIIQVKGQYDEKMFSETNNRIKRNIFGAFNNIPEPLVMGADSSLFGTGSETYKEMKIFYSQQTEEEREKLQECLAYLGFPYVIAPIAKEVIAAEARPTTEAEGPEGTEAPKVDDATAEAQASLRGSVGGVQGILSIQQAVTAGTADFESAITILIEIYGFKRSIATSLLGKPDTTEINNP
jgi:hypothetical protein